MISVRGEGNSAWLFVKNSIAESKVTSPPFWVLVQGWWVVISDLKNMAD